MAVIEQYDGSVDDTNNFGNNDKEAQSFTVPVNASCTGFSVKGTKGLGTTGSTFVAEIRSGSATGTIIVSEQFAKTLLPDYTATPIFTDISWTTPADLSTGITYFLILYPDSGTSGNDELRWSLDSTSPSYANGSRWFVLNGAAWAEQTTTDHNFKILGTENVVAGQSMSLLGVQ